MMPPRDPFTFPTFTRRFDTVHRAMLESQRRPPIGVTQGGSSRPDPGCKPAATTADGQKFLAEQARKEAKK